jgi:hypothetical protein
MTDKTLRADLRVGIWAAVSSKAQADEEKDSLPLQIREGKRLTELWKGRIVAVYEVPGHSRDYLSLEECAEDMAKHNITAFRDLQSDMKQKAFDVLICRDGNRFARTQALHAYIVEYIVTVMEAKIFVSRTGLWVDRSNFRNFIALDGYQAANELDTMKHRYRLGMAKRAEQGKHPLNGTVFHNVIRDRLGTSQGLEIREELRYLWEKATELLLDGVELRQISYELYSRFGYVNPETGKPFGENFWIQFFYSPFTWGYFADGLFRERKWARYGVWGFDEIAEIPEGVRVNRNPTVPIPVFFPGEDGEEIKTELRRRQENKGGRANSYNTQKFTGLMLCAVCGRTMGSQKDLRSKNGTYYWRCNMRLKKHYIICPNRDLVHEKRVERQINRFLERWLALETPDITPLLSSSKPDDTASRIANLEREIADLNSEIDTLILYQRKAKSASLQERYGAELEEADQRLNSLQASLKALRSRGTSKDVQAARQLAKEQLLAEGLEHFWQRPTREINQVLHAIFAGYKFLVKGKEIIDLVNSDSLPPRLRG